MWRGSVWFTRYLLTVGTCGVSFAHHPDGSAEANHLLGASPDPPPHSVSPSQSILRAGETQAEILKFSTSPTTTHSTRWREVFDYPRGEGG